MNSKFKIISSNNNISTEMEKVPIPKSSLNKSSTTNDTTDSYESFHSRNSNFGQLLKENELNDKSDNSEGSKSPTFSLADSFNFEIYQQNIISKETMLMNKHRKLSSSEIDDDQAKSKLIQPKSTFPFGKCKVCRDKATGVHYGIATCEGCKVNLEQKF